MQNGTKRFLLEALSPLPFISFVGMLLAPLGTLCLVGVGIAWLMGAAIPDDLPIAHTIKMTVAGYICLVLSYLLEKIARKEI